MIPRFKGLPRRRWRPNARPPRYTSWILKRKCFRPNNAMRRGRLERPTVGLEIQSTSDVSGEITSTCDRSKSVLAECLALLSETRPDLAALIGAWDSLPKAIRAGIQALIQAAQS